MVENEAESVEGIQQQMIKLMKQLTELKASQSKSANPEEDECQLIPGTELQVSALLETLQTKMKE